jgi:hypothetical protein
MDWEIDGLIDERINGWMGGWIDRWMEKWAGGRIDGSGVQIMCELQSCVVRVTKVS